MGRPSKLNDELIDKMYEKIKKGLPVHYTCDLFSITYQSHLNWLKQGESDFNADVDSLEARYFDMIKKGQAEYVDDALTDIRSGRPGWQGAAWCLERTRRDFQPTQQIDAGPDGKVNVIIGGKVKDIKTNDNTQ